jgi:hypothetical protein
MANGYYIPGSNYVVCDICGARRRSEDVVIRWDNATTCKEKSRCNEEQHPQELIGTVQDNSLPAIISSEPSVVFIAAGSVTAEDL